MDDVIKFLKLEFGFIDLPSDYHNPISVLKSYNSYNSWTDNYVCLGLKPFPNENWWSRHLTMYTIIKPLKNDIIQIHVQVPHGYNKYRTVGLFDGLLQLQNRYRDMEKIIAQYTKYNTPVIWDNANIIGKHRYHIRNTTNEYYQMIDWLITNFGPEHQRWCLTARGFITNSSTISTTVCLRRKTDAVLFKLKYA